MFEHYKLVYTIINQEVGIDIKEMIEFKQLEQLSRSLQEKKDDVKHAVDNELAKVIERDIYLAADKPRARDVFESLQKMKSKEDINQKLLRMEEGLGKKYNEQKKQIIASL